MDDDAPGVPEWVVTYGDMMSLLLTFFIMLVSLSEVVADQKYRAVLDALQKYVGYRSGPLSPPGKNFPLNAMIQKLGTLGSFTDLEKEFGRGGIRVKAPPGDDFRVLRSRSGTAFAVGDLILFEPGQATLSKEAHSQLEEIAEDLAGKKNKIEIRAHADPRAAPNSTTHREKLDITFGRARNVYHVLQKLKITPERLRITAAADAEPLQQSADSQSMHHDRVEILILDTLVDDFVGPREGQK